jgi:hypothetical protein
MQFLGASLDLARLRGYSLPPVNVTNVANVFSIDLTQGNEFVVTTAADSQIKLPVPVAGQQYTVTIVYTGNHVISWAWVSGSNTLKWAGGTAPTPTAVNGKEDIFIFSSRIDGTVRGSNGGQNY